MTKSFASDNNAGVCPEAWAAMEKANSGHAPGYGDDYWTERAAAMIRDLFATRCEVFFVYNGTAANALALASMCQSYHSVLCHAWAHVERDECGAPEFFSNGAKVRLLEGNLGKLQPDAIESAVRRRTDVHFPKPRALSLTQSTEVGTVYTVAETRAIGALAKGLGLRIHMDGARFANAVASLEAAPREMTWEAGIDVLCLGGTKNGTAVGDAVVFFNLELADEFHYRRKQAGQLASKMRYLSAPWIGLLESGAWLRNAAHANRMAELLDRALRPLPEIQLLYPRQANAVFAELPKPVVQRLHDRGWRFYTFAGAGGSRLMCSWDTTEEDVRAFTADLKDLL